jgi:outer membrane biosynthesis protein TonB
MSLVAGELATLDVRVDADSGVSRKVVWTSSDSRVATVDALGRLIAVGNGLTTITATSAANSVVSASASVSVVPPLERRTTAADRAPASANEQTYFEFQVTTQVTPLPANPNPRYPDSLRVAGFEGEVLMQFVFDTLGLADMSTVKVLRSSHPLFTYAVWDVLPRVRFVPAELNGKKVRQLVQMPFQFSMTRGKP